MPKYSGFFEDRKLAEEITNRENERMKPQVIIGFDRMSEDHHKFHTGLKFTPVDRW